MVWLKGRNPRSEFNTNQFLANRAKTRRPRRNIFVEYLNWHKAGIYEPIHPIKGQTRNGFQLRSDTTDTETVAYEVATAWYGSTRLAEEQLFQNGRCDS